MVKKDRKANIFNLLTGILFVMVFSLMPENEVYAAVTEVTIGDYKYSLNDSKLTASVIEYVGAGGDLSIPDMVTDGVNTYRVTSIGDSAFGGCSTLVSVTIPNGVTSIGKYAFEGCSCLNSVNIPDSVTSIMYSAFNGCSSLTDVTIPNGVTSIGNFAFNGCSSLTSVTIPNGVTSIGGYTFSGCSGLLSVNIPDNVTSVGNGAFSGCSSLTIVTIPDRLTELGPYAFMGCSSLPNITIPFNVTNIGNGTFNGCSSLTSVTLPGSVTSIGAYSFDSCRSLTSVTIPSDVTSIELGAFNGCTGLETVYYPEGLDISASSLSSFGATMIRYTVGEDDTVTLLVEKIQSGTNALEIPVTIDGKTVSGIQCAEGVNKLTITPNIPAQTIDTLCTDNVVADVVLCDNWIWQDEDKEIVLTVGSPIAATAVYNGLDKELYSNTEVEIIINTEHTGETALKNTKTTSCKEAGYTGDICCATCDIKLSEGSTIPKTENHTYDEGMISRHATVTEKGIMIYTCTVCKVIKTEDIAKLPAILVETPKEEETEEFSQTEEEIDTSVEIKEEDTTPVIIPEPADKGNGDASDSEAETQKTGVETDKDLLKDKETVFNTLFVIILVVVLVVAGGGMFIFIKKKKRK